MGCDGVVAAHGGSAGRLAAAAGFVPVSVRSRAALVEFSGALYRLQVVAGSVPHVVGRVAGTGQLPIQAGSCGWASQGVACGEVVGEMGCADAVGPPVTGRGAGRRCGPLLLHLFSYSVAPRSSWSFRSLAALSAVGACRSVHRSQS